MSKIVIVILMYHPHKPTDLIKRQPRSQNLFEYTENVRYEFKTTGHTIMNSHVPEVKT
jgi:hypothetical protein